MERLEPKAPVEVTNYRFTWDTFLGEDTIATSNFVVTGATKVSQTNDATSTTVVISGGTDNTVATITNTITTAGGLTETEDFILPIRQRSEPVSLNEAKAQLRIIDDDSEDALISSYIQSARTYVESQSGFVFVRRQFVESFDYWPRHLSIGRRPLISIDSIAYIDSAGASQTLNGSNYYTALLLRRVTPVGSWPTLGNGGSIMVTYTAGFDEGEQAEEVDLARQAILLLVTTWFENRSSVSTNNIQASEIPFTATALIDRFRTMVV